MPDAAPLDEDGAPRVTLKDVARKLGVSHVSVSVALRDRSGVSSELKERIKKTAAEMGYTPEPMARALAVYRHNKRQVHVHSALAWINFWPNPKALRALYEFDLYWKGATEAAVASGYHLEEFTLRDSQTLARLEGILRARGIRGIMIPPHPQQIDWSGFRFKDFAIVKIGHSQHDPLTYVAAPDQVGNALLAYDQAKAAGYRKIGYVGCLERVIKWWFAGAILMEQVTEPASQRIPPLFLKKNYAEPNWFESKMVLGPLETWLGRHRPEVVICESGDLRLSVEKLGFQVPKDFAMVNLSFSPDARVDAGIYQNPTLIGKAATDTLIGLINRNEWGEARHCHTVTVAGSWVEGSSMPEK